MQQGGFAGPRPLAAGGDELLGIELLEEHARRLAALLSLARVGDLDSEFVDAIPRNGFAVDYEVEFGVTSFANISATEANASRPTFGRNRARP